MKTSVKLYCAFLALLSCASAGSAFAWHDHYRGGVAIYEGYPAYPGYYDGPPVVVESPPVIYAAPYPAPVYAQPAPPAYAPVPQAPIYQAQNGQYCREYQTRINVAGQLRTSFGTACQQPDGSWRMVN